MDGPEMIFCPFSTVILCPRSVSEANSDDLDDLTLKDAGKDPKDAAVAKAAQGLAGPLRKLLEELLKDLSAK